VAGWLACWLGGVNHTCTEQRCVGGEI